MREDLLTLGLSQPQREGDKVGEIELITKKRKPEVGVPSPTSPPPPEPSFSTFSFLGPCTLQGPPPWPPLYVDPSWQPVVPPPAQQHGSPEYPRPPPSRPSRTPRNPIANGKSEHIEPPYAWASNRRATVLPIEVLIEKGIDTISGDVQCKRCDHKTTMTYDLVSRFEEVAHMIVKTKDQMHRRAPARWMNPKFPACPSCGQDNRMKPIIAPKKRAINWLFMLLGQTIGVCTLEQLKYHCKHMKKHRTGAKNRLLYTTYLEICMQLDPHGPFEDD